MSNHGSTNLGEMFNADLNQKVMSNIEDEAGRNRPCNCDVRTKLENGACMYGEKCRHKFVIYELKDRLSGNSYYGKTQQDLKKRTSKHITEVWHNIENQQCKAQGLKLANPNSGSDSFSKFFSQYCTDCTSGHQVRAKMKQILEVKIIWNKTDRIKCMKTATTRNCKLCMKERITIMQALRENKHKVINNNTEVYGCCSCKPGFHEFVQISEPHDHAAALRTRTTQKKVTPKRKNKRGSPRSRKKLNSTPKPITPETLSTSKKFPNFYKARREARERHRLKEKRSLMSDLEAESYDC